MKHLTNKQLSKRGLALLLCAMAVFMLCSCSDTYKEYRTEENIAASASVGGHRINAYFFLLPEGGAVLEAVCDGCCDGEILQTIEFPTSGEYYSSLDFEFAFARLAFQDMNFDGKKDLYVPCSVTTENLEGMAWLWDTEKNAFVLSKELSSLYELTVFPDEKLITSQDYSSPDGVLCSEYKWEDGKLVKVGEYTVNY